MELVTPFTNIRPLVRTNEMCCYYLTRQSCWGLYAKTKHLIGGDPCIYNSCGPVFGPRPSWPH